MKKIVCKTLLLFPQDVINKITNKCWFISSFEDSWAFALRAADLKADDSLIFLSDELLSESESQIQFTIAHEIGHIILGHKNSIGKIQTAKEINKQESEADQFALLYTSGMKE